MPALIVNRGLQVIGGRASATADAFGSIQAMSVDDSAGAFAAGHNSLDGAGAVGNEFDADFDATPTRSGQQISHVMTIPSGSGNFVIRRVALHNAPAASVSASSVSLVAGIDGQSITKTADFALTVTVRITYTSV